MSEGINHLSDKIVHLWVKRIFIYKCKDYLPVGEKIAHLWKMLKTISFSFWKQQKRWKKYKVMFNSNYQHYETSYITLPTTSRVLELNRMCICLEDKLIQ